ncbi:MAG: SDR family oxidoreductase, partial [Rubrobacteraceae bacterium]
MTKQSRILVTGATGNVGGQVVSQLASAGAAVRALVRDPAAADMPEGVEAVVGDLSKPNALEDA